MENNPLLQQIATMKQSLLNELILDEALFTELENLASNEDPSHAVNLINWNYQRSQKIIATLEELMAKTPIDYRELVKCIDKLKLGSLNVGAKTMAMEVNMAVQCCNVENFEELKHSLERLKTENENFKAKMVTYFQLVKQAKDAK